MTSVPGGADLERKNQYWIDLGTVRERERIIALLESIKTYPTGWDYDDPFASVVALIKGKSE